jgi:type VI secretion system secreted protein VgrG
MSLARVAVVQSPLAEGALLLRSMRCSEALGRPFRYDLELLTADANLDLGALLGQTMTVALELQGGETREFTGHVTEFSLAGGAGRHVLYRAQLRPWLELLSYQTNCRIFQQQTVPDVVKQIFREHGFSDFEEKLTDSYRAWEYLVQYRESDFNFVSRMLEQEGIYYYFKHQAGVHTLVLADSRSAHAAVPGYEEIPYYPPEHGAERDREHVDAWYLTRRIQPGAVAASDFDFTRPRASLLTRRSEPQEQAGAAFEAYDYPGEFLQTEEGDKEVRVRLEAHHAEQEVAEGAGNAAGLSVGALFSLSQFPRTDQNKEYLVVRADYHIQVNADESGVAGSGAPGYRCQFAAIDSQRPYRTPRHTRKPLVEGPQTAIVVGLAGEEIYTDEYGRVKVKFHWDRVGAGDENSSCWVRVAQLWAGTNFGGIHIPRIGQEVIVDFLEGDPDRPIITGRVYNFDNQVPYALPGNQTQSGIKSRSSKGGNPSNFNELRFEDKKGSEQLSAQAEKDLSVLVKNAETRKVGASRSVNIGTDDVLEVGAKRDARIGADDSESVAASQNVHVGANQTITVTLVRSIAAASENIGVGTRTKTVASNETTSVGGSRSETVTRSETVSIGKDQIVTIGGKRSHSVDKDETLSVAGKRVQTVSKDDQLQVGKRLVISAADEIVLKSGDATLTLKKNGDIVLKGKNLQLDGSGKINVKASSNLVLKGSKISSN